MKIHRARKVLITGATSGIGRRVAARFAENGWDLICHYSSSEKIAYQLRESTEKLGLACKLFKVDFSSGAQVSDFVSKVARLKIDSLINNAVAYIGNKHFSRLRLADIETVFMVNVFAPILFSSKIFNSMKKNGFGRIVNISSVAAKYGGSSYSMEYGCSKLALEGMTKTMAKEGASKGVLVNTIRPGVIDTEFHKKYPKDIKKRIAMIPMKKMGRPEDIADMAYYLGSEENSFITNQTIAISGGE